LKRRRPGAGTPDADLAARIDAFQQRLGYRFSDPALLHLALTHKSAGDGQRGFAHNERLEWLGDRVLGFLCARDLYAAEPGAQEGELTRRFNARVSGAACAQTARALGMEDVIVVTRGIAPDTVRSSDSILGDTFEAVMAALWLDGGMEAAAILYAHTRAQESLAREIANPKNALQEWVQKRSHAIPAYRVLTREGPDHEPRFEVEVEAAGLTARAWGTSKQGAEQEAARVLIRQEGLDV
jgi:ribonuclease III